MNLSLNGKIAVVTGADSGIGFATAKILAREGAGVILNDKTEDELEEAALSVKKNAKSEDNIAFFSADLRNNDEVQALASFCQKNFGSVDILVHCAGIRGAAGDFLSLGDADWLESIEVDLLSGVRVCRAFLPSMLEKNRAGLC